MDGPAGTADRNEDRRLDQLFEILSHPFRRHILFRLSECASCSERDLTVGARHADGDEPNVLAIQLRHIHFPKLADAGYIEWDESSDTVRRGPLFDEIEPVLGLLRDHREELPGTSLQRI